MISPLGQRQILQTATVEAHRLAGEGSAQAQGEQVRRAAFLARAEAAQRDVAAVPESSESLRLGRDGGGRGGAGAGGGDHPGAEAEDAPQAEAHAAAHSADGAGSRLDLLA